MGNGVFVFRGCTASKKVVGLGFETRGTRLGAVNCSVDMLKINILQIHLRLRNSAIKTSKY